MTQPAQSTQPRRGRRLLILLLLLVILVAINLLYVPAVSWRSVVSGAPGDVLYAAGFDGFTDEWQQYEGRQSAQISDGVLRLSIGDSDVIYSAADPYFADFDLSVTARAVEGDVNNAFGVVFRLLEPSDDCQMPLRIMCDVADSSGLFGAGLNLLFRQPQESTGYYMFLISSDGYYSVWRNSEEDQGGRAISTWIPREDIINTGLNAENRIRVVGTGNEYRFFINGTQVPLCIPDDPGGQSTYYSLTEECIQGQMLPVLEDDTLPLGRVALVVDSVSSLPGFTIEFDDLIITSPQESLEEADQL
ncbi:MAG: hypothetical protein KC496_06645 [Anaerolineae bacterium]|nr:hypothetical protein [Anaerolineae bacterium]